MRGVLLCVADFVCWFSFIDCVFRVMIKKLLLYFVIFEVGFVGADEIRLQGGGMFNGTILSVSESCIEIETAFAGILNVAREQVASFSTQQVAVVDARQSRVEVNDGTGGPTDVSENDRKGNVALKSGKDERAVSGTIDKQDRKWQLKLTSKMSGRSGNSDTQNVALDVTAKWVGQKDELKLTLSGDQEQNKGETSSDEREVGVRYTSYFSDPWGWYVQQEFGQERFKDVLMSSSSALGISYRKVDGKQLKYSFSVGVDYSYEQYVSDTIGQSSFGLNLETEQKFGTKGSVAFHNEFSFSPSLDESLGFEATQDAYVDMPLGESKKLKLRLGLSNEYDSAPGDGVEPIDTRYYSSLVAEFK
jgi:hypothetical protein